MCHHHDALKPLLIITISNPFPLVTVPFKGDWLLSHGYLKQAKKQQLNWLVFKNDNEIYGVGAKSQILSSVAPHRKKNLVTFQVQSGTCLGVIYKPMFY